MQRNKHGQMSLVLIVIIAMGLVLMALVMNWNRMVQIKTQSQVACTVAASALVSRMASYGENQMQTYLEGKTKKCDQNGILGIIIMIILIVVIIVVSIFTCGAGGAAGAGIFTTAMAGMSGTFIVGMTIALVLTVVTLVIQIAVIQPMITRMWNKMQQNIKTIEDSFLESGLSTAMQGVVTDTETIPDLLDYDMNGKWNVPGLNGSDPKERVARFVYHYTQRLNLIGPYTGTSSTTNNSTLTGVYPVFKDEMLQFEKDLGLKNNNGCTGNRCDDTCYFHPPNKAGDDFNLECETTPEPFPDYPLSYDALTRGTSTDPAAVFVPPTLVGLLGTERATHYNSLTGKLEWVTSNPPEMAVERGPLFHFLWNLKEAVDINNANVIPSERGSYGIFIRDRGLLTYFYEPEIKLECPALNAEGTVDDLPVSGTNQWLPGNNLFCNSNLTGIVVSAPHNANCLPCAVTNPDGTLNMDACGCAARDTLAWKEDALDADLTHLRNFTLTMDTILSKPDAQVIALKSQPGIKEEWDALMGGNGTMRQVEADSRKVYQVLSDSQLSSDDTVMSRLTGGSGGFGEPQLMQASAAAKVFVDNFNEAAGNAFGCSSATPGSGPLNPVECANHGDRIGYLNYLFSQPWETTTSTSTGNVVDTSSDEGLAEPIISSYMIYGWQSGFSNGHRGYRHVIKVEAATPKRCEWWTNELGGVFSPNVIGKGMASACGPNKFPWVKTKKKGLKRCYFMINTSGCVKVRISRWDEDRLSQMISFVSGSPLWRVLSGHPAYDGQPKAKDLETCFTRDKMAIDGKEFYIPDSFMINQDKDYLLKYGLECQAAVEDALKKSFVTEVCAKYYLDPPGDDNATYKMRFFPCSEGCTLVDKELDGMFEK